MNTMVIVKDKEGARIKIMSSFSLVGSDMRAMVARAQKMPASSAERAQPSARGAGYQPLALASSRYVGGRMSLHAALRATGVPTCEACPAGSYSSAVDSGTCMLCGIGFYNAGIARSACTACASGTLTRREGATAATDCDFASTANYVVDLSDANFAFGTGVAGAKPTLRLMATTGTPSYDSTVGATFPSGSYLTLANASLPNLGLGTNLDFLVAAMKASNGGYSCNVWMRSTQYNRRFIPMFGIGSNAALQSIDLAAWADTSASAFFWIVSQPTSTSSLWVVTPVGGAIPTAGQYCTSYDLADNTVVASYSTGIINTVSLSKAPIITSFRQIYGTLSEKTTTGTSSIGNFNFTRLSGSTVAVNDLLLISYNQVLMYFKVDSVNGNSISLLLYTGTLPVQNLKWTQMNVTFDIAITVYTAATWNLQHSWWGAGNDQQVDVPSTIATPQTLAAKPSGAMYGDWHMYSISWSSVDKIRSIYMDGVLLGMNLTTTIPGVTSENFYVNRGVYRGADSGVDTQMSDLRMWARALSDKEIVRLLRETRPDRLAVTSTSVSDTASAYLTVTVAGAALTSSKTGTSLPFVNMTTTAPVFDVANKRVSITGGNALSMTGTDVTQLAGAFTAEYTVNIWAYFSDHYSTTSVPSYTLFGLGTSANNCALGLTFWSTPPTSVFGQVDDKTRIWRPHLMWYNNDLIGSNVPSALATPWSLNNESPKQMHMYTVTWSLANGGLRKIFFDGVRVAVDVRTAAPAFNATNVINGVTTAPVLYLGRYVNNTLPTGAASVTCTIGGFRIWTTELTEAQVQKLYSEGAR